MSNVRTKTAGPKVVSTKMIKPGIRTLLSAVVILVSVSIARADTFTVDSGWSTGAAEFDNLTTYQGDGTFTWDGTSFSAISFSFVETSPSMSTIWTATSTDGSLETFGGFEHLILGNAPPPGTDCQDDCVAIALASSLATGGPQVVTGVGAGNSSSEPNTTFLYATVTDTTYGSTPEPASVILLLTMLAAVGYGIGRKRHARQSSAS